MGVIQKIWPESVEDVMNDVMIYDGVRRAILSASKKVTRKGHTFYSFRAEVLDSVCGNAVKQIHEIEKETKNG